MFWDHLDIFDFPTNALHNCLVGGAAKMTLLPSQVIDLSSEGRPSALSTGPAWHKAGLEVYQSTAKLAAKLSATRTVISSTLSYLKYMKYMKPIP